jgi:hypothetical protein
MSDIIEHIRALSEETDNILVWNDDDLEAQKDAEIIQEENLVKVKADK